MIHSSYAIHQMRRRNWNKPTLMLFHEWVFFLLGQTKLRDHPSSHTTIHHHPQPPTTSQSLFTNIHHHPPLAKICSLPSTTSHQQPNYIHHHPLPPANNRNISTIIYYHPSTAKIYKPAPTTLQNIFKQEGVLLEKYKDFFIRK